MSQKNEEKAKELENRQPLAGAVAPQSVAPEERTDGGDKTQPTKVRVTSGFKRYRTKQQHYRQGVLYPAGSVLEIPADEPPGSDWLEVSADVHPGLVAPDQNPNPMPPSPVYAKDTATLATFAPPPGKSETPVDPQKVQAMKDARRPDGGRRDKE